jgi:hypothetical protein
MEASPEILEPADSDVLLRRAERIGTTLERHMTVTWIRRAIVRDLDALAAQLAAYPDDTDLWSPVPGVSNVGGTLALHLAGNLRHLIGVQLGSSAYVRDRDREFSARNVSRAEITSEIAAAREEVDQSLRALGESELERDFPLAIGGAQLSTGQVLVHLSAHLAYHLGQIDYHRRVVTGAGSIPGMQSAPALAD